MQDRRFTKYSSLELTKVPQNIATRLYSIAPLYIGSSGIESLTSYISRLALAHCVYPGILMERVLKQVVNKKHSSANLHNLYSFTGAINGTGTMGLDLVTALEQLTSQKQLDLLTLASFSELIPSRKLFHEHRKWCPQCFNSWKKQQHELYEPLIWNIKAVEVCSIHNFPLQDKCPYCDRPNYHLAWKTRPGYCSKCDRSLGEVDLYKQLSIQDNDLNWYLWVNENIGELLSKREVEDFSRSNKTIGESLTKYAESNFQGNMAAFARFLQMPKNTVWMWCKNKSQPSLEMLLRICHRLEISVWHFLTQEKTTQSKTTNILAPPPQLKSKARKTIHDRDHIREHLEQVLNKNNSDPPSMEQVAKDLQINRRTIFQYFPELCRAISANYIKHRNATHQKAIEKSCQEVREAVRQLHSEGKYPSQNKIEKLISRPGLLRYIEVNWTLGMRSRKSAKITT